MSLPGASKNHKVEAPVAANAATSSKLKSPVEPDSPQKSKAKTPVASDPSKTSRLKTLAATEVLNPRDFVSIQALVGFPHNEGRVLARSSTVFKSSEPSRDQVFWENYRRRQKQFTQGHFTPAGKPYRDIGQMVYIDPKEFTLYSLGQLAQEPVKYYMQEEPPREVAEVATTENSLDPESDSLEPVKRPSPSRERGKDLKTLGKAFARSRGHISSVKQGGEYFQILHQESLERDSVPKADQQVGSMRGRTEFQLPIYSGVPGLEHERNILSLAEGSHMRTLGKQKKNITLWSFTPVHTSVLITSPPGTKSESLFRQLCAIHWLLEALTNESSCSMQSISTCWNPRNPGGHKKTVEEKEDEKLAAYLWDLFTTNTKKFLRKARYSPLKKKIKRTPTQDLSPHSSRSSLCAKSLCGSETSTVFCSEDTTEVNEADFITKSAQAKEQKLFPSLQIIQKVSKGFHKQDDVVKKTEPQRLPVVQRNYKAKGPISKDQGNLSGKQRPGNQSSFVKSKSNLCADMRQKFTEVREEAAAGLHDTLESLERTQEERCWEKFDALKHLTDFRKDMERVREVGKRAEKEHDEVNWFPVLLARLPESVKSDRYVQKILEKLEKFGMNPDLEIDPDIFLKIVGDLQEWELCSPEIAAAVEFVRESIVKMPEEDFREWFQTQLTS
ncbi:PREDICTED: coiled-coil domain-containing protein 60 [Chaetura pelagica]|uniref:coiled-coil domain-containing protein 60 n=1 Tax=Chaetura pelagica TaxID=8897 RepID=UPI0005231D96|nr:PREDICTED: coiled-coil domain-containing protein 60 [Chaetura pelagica]